MLKVNENVEKYNYSGSRKAGTSVKELQNKSYDESFDDDILDELRRADQDQYDRDMVYKLVYKKYAPFDDKDK